MFEHSVKLMVQEKFQSAELSLQRSMGLLFLLDIFKTLPAVDGEQHPSIRRGLAILKPYSQMFFSSKISGESLAHKIKMLLFLFRVRCMLKIGDFYNVRYYSNLLHADFHGADLVKFLGTSPVRIQYPKPFLDIVQKWGTEYGVSHHLIYALMREESHFKKDIISSAGARGLMQIMLETGREMAALLGRVQKDIPSPLSEEDLFVESINIHLGIYYFSRLLKQFQGNKIKALAAYNAGLTNVTRWSKGVSDDQKFLERITFPETRRYIFKVLSTEFYYDEIYHSNE